MTARQRPTGPRARPRAPRARPRAGAGIAAHCSPVPCGVIVLDPGGLVVAHGPDPRGVGDDGGIRPGINLLDLLTADPALDAATANHLADGIVSVGDAQRDGFTCEYQHATATGPRWIAVTVSPFPEPPPRRLLLLHQDVTDRKLAEAALRQSQQRYRRLLDRGREIVVLTDANGRVRFVNAATERAFGYGPGDYARLAIWELLHPDDLDAGRRLLAALLDHPAEPATAEVRIRHLHGHWIWVACLAWNLLDDPEIGAIALYGREASEARRARDALREAEGRLAAVLDSPRTWLQMLAPDGTVLVTNAVAREVAGLGADHGPGRPVWAAPCWAALPEAEAGFREAVQQAGRGRAARLELPVAEPSSGIPRIFDFSIRPVFDDAGRVTLLVCEGYDVTPARRIDKVLRDVLDGIGGRVGAAFFPALVEHLCRSLGVDAALVAEMRGTGRLQTLAVWANGQAAPNFEVDAAGTALELAGDPRASTYASGVRRAFPRDRLLRDLGADAYVGVPLPGAGGQAVGVLAVLHGRPLDDAGRVADVLRLFGGRAGAELERLRAREEVQAVQDRLEREVEARATEARRRALALDCLDVGVAVFDGDVVSLANHAFARLYGYPSAAAVAGCRWRDLHAAAEGDADPLLAARRQGRWHGDLAGRRRDGTRFDVEATVQRTPHGDLVCTARDVTHERQTQSALRQQVHQLTTATADLVTASRARDLCIASLSHELRTPLHVILGLAEALRDGVHGPLADAQERSVHGIEASARHLLDVVNDFRDLATASASEVELERTAIDVRTLVEECVRPVRPTIRDRNLSFAIAFGDDVATVWADERRLRRVLTALLTDTARRTPPEGRFGLEVAAHHPPGSVAFTVWGETGAPAAAGSDARDAAQDVPFGPTSALLFRLVEFHGGTVTLDSDAERGTRVSVVLPPPGSAAAAPLAPAPAAPAVTEPLRARGDGAILLAEDNETNARFLSDYLEAIGYRVVVARDGREAVERALAAPPALVLMDIQMPEVDGLEAIRLMRGEPRLAGVPIVALTALAMPGDRERCLAAGANAYVAKPLSLKELRAMLAAYLGPPAPPAVAPAPGGRG